MTYIPGHSPARKWRNLNRADLLLLVLAGAFGVWFFWKAGLTARHRWDWEALAPYVFYRDAAGNRQSGVLLRGLYFTLRLGFWSMLLALLSGALVGALSAHRRGMAALPANLYINLMRNTPPLVLLFLMFFFAGSFFTEPLFRVERFIASGPEWLRQGFAMFVSPQGQLDRMFAAVLTLGLYEGAYVAEIVRAGLESVPKAQYEASLSQGFSSWQCFRHIIGPQAFRLMLPPLAGQTISTFKETTLASVISLPELTFQSLEVMAVTRMTFELWLATAAIYLVLSYAWAGLGRWLEHRQRWRPVS